jgi:beta-fructofuranosidase
MLEVVHVDRQFDCPSIQPWCTSQSKAFCWAKAICIHLLKALLLQKLNSMATSGLLTLESTLSFLHEKEPIVSVSSIASDPEATHELDSSRRWRPRLHLTAPHGWINDPCGPGYDPVNEVYHLGFQWNPNDTEWGNISWGAAASHDMLSWNIAERPSMQPSKESDPGGVFSGCLVPTAIDGKDGTLTAVYTSVSRLPIHHTLPYSRSSEAVALATSTDSGRTWTRHSSNPILAEPPEHLDVTGWRDPFVQCWPAMDKLITTAQSKDAYESLYAIVAGGIRGKGPTAFLYRVNAHALDQWEYLGFLLAPGANYCPSPRWTGDLGLNWEVSNFLTLSSAHPDISRYFLICGVEGRLATQQVINTRGSMRATNAQMWICGSLERCKGSWMTYRYGGRLDHGTYYAGNSFWDPPTKQNIIFGWLLEDDLDSQLRRQQGWAGIISLPRVLKLHVLRSVVGTLHTPLRLIGSIELIPEDGHNYSFTIVSLCAIPDSRRHKLRSQPLASTGRLPLVFPEAWPQWEMQLSFTVDDNALQLGFDITHSPSKY